MDISEPSSFLEPVMIITAIYNKFDSGYLIGSTHPCIEFTLNFAICFIHVYLTLLYILISCMVHQVRLKVTYNNLTVNPPLS